MGISGTTRSTGRRRRAGWLATTVAVAALLPTAGAAGAAQAAQAPAAPYCGIAWGSGPEQTADTDHVIGDVTQIRSGRHACFDRVVLDGSWWASVRYVDTVRADGSGDVVPLRGGARLEVVASTGGPGPTPAALTPRRTDAVDVTGYRTLRQVRVASDFEGLLTVGVGVRGRLPFRVFVLGADGPSPRVVVDVAHRW
jgi:hypothetical protein